MTMGHKLKIWTQWLEESLHRVSAKGIAPDPDEVKCIKDFPIPATSKQLQSFLGLAGYYPRFVKDFAKIASPLNQMLLGTAQNPGNRDHLFPSKWNQACDYAFNALKMALTSAPILGFTNFNLPFIVYTDASNQGLGAVLSQVHYGKERVIAFASRSLSPCDGCSSNPHIDSHRVVTRVIYLLLLGFFT